MQITDLNDRQIEILQLILEYIGENPRAHLTAVIVWKNVKERAPDLTNQGTRDFLNYLQLLGVGTYTNDKGFKVDAIALDSVLRKGGIRSIIEGERQKTIKEAEKSEIDFQLKIKQLEDVKFRLATAETQLKNQNFYWIVASVGILVALLKSFGLLGR